MDNDELLIKIKEVFDTKVDEVKRHSAVLFESLEKKVEIIAEGHDILNNKLDKVDQRVEKIEQRVVIIENELTEVKKDVKGLKSDLNIVKDYIVGVDEKLNEHELIFKGVK